MQAKVLINTRRRHGHIHPHIYGYFLEHTGNAIYGGMYEPGPHANERGFRRDVLEAARQLNVPILRWPGGNFASAYNWQDGVGPKNERPRRLEVTWSNTPSDPGAVEESNHFGTNEFIEYCRAIGADAYINLNSASAGFLEAMRWLEYCNYDGDTEMAELRRSHGYEQPHGVRYWGIGNEVWGPWQVGHVSASEYATVARDIAHFARHVDPHAKILAVGWVDPRWNLDVLDKTGTEIDYLTVHLYTRTDFRLGVDDYYATLGGSVGFEQVLRSVAQQVAGYRMRNGVQRPIFLSVDEWNLSHRGRADMINEGFGRKAPRTLMDALFVAGVLNGFHRLSNAVKMANYVQMVNNHAPILVRENQLVKTPLFYVMDWYHNVLGDTAISADVVVDSRREKVNVSRMTFPVDLPYLDATATLTEDGHSLAIALVNRNREEQVHVSLETAGITLPDKGELHILASADPFDENTFDQPEKVRPESDVFAGTQITLPPHSLVVLRWALG